VGRQSGASSTSVSLIYGGWHPRSLVSSPADACLRTDVAWSHLPVFRGAASGLRCGSRCQFSRAAPVRSRAGSCALLTVPIPSGYGPLATATNRQALDLAQLLSEFPTGQERAPRLGPGRSSLQTELSATGCCSVVGRFLLPRARTAPRPTPPPSPAARWLPARRPRVLLTSRALGGRLPLTPTKGRGRAPLSISELPCTSCGVFTGRVQRAANISVVRVPMRGGTI
jgi:hypothetical protein